MIINLLKTYWRIYSNLFFVGFNFVLCLSLFAMWPLQFFMLIFHLCLLRRGINYHFPRNVAAPATITEAGDAPPQIGIADLANYDQHLSGTMKAIMEFRPADPECYRDKNQYRLEISGSDTKEWFYETDYDGKRNPIFEYLDAVIGRPSKPFEVEVTISRSNPEQKDDAFINW